MSSNSWLQYLSRLSVRGDYARIIEVGESNLEELDADALGVVAMAAFELGVREVLDAASVRLASIAPAAEDTLQIEFRRAVLLEDRAEVSRLQRQISEWGPLAPQQVVQAGALLHLRAHAWTDLEDLLARCGSAVSELPAPLLRARAVLGLRRRAYQAAIQDALEVFAAEAKPHSQDTVWLLARCYEAAGELDKAALTYRDDASALPAHPKLHYRAALVAVRVRRFPMARHMMQLATRAGAAGPWMEWIRGYVELNFRSADAAQSIFKELCEREPDNVVFALAWIDAFESKARPSDTLALVEDLLTRLEDPELRRRQVQLLRLLGRGEEAERALDAGLQVYPREPRLIELQGQDAAAATDDAQTPATSGNPGSVPAGQSGRAVESDEDSAGDHEIIKPPPVEQWPAEFRPRWTPAELRRHSSFGRALMTQIRVIHALTLREIRTKYAGTKLGYFWSFIEPAMHIGIFYTLWSVRGTTKMDDLPLLLFLVTGFIPYFLFAQSYQECVGSVKKDAQMLQHASVTPFDLLWVRVFLELLSRIVIFSTMLFLIWLAHIDFKIFELGMIMVAFGMLWLLGAGLGFAVEAFSSIAGTLPRVVSRLMRFLYFTSGVMFPVATMPPEIQEILLWNPLVHLISTVRFAFMGTDPMDGVNLTYPFMFMLALFMLGLVSLRALQRRLTSA